jgi:hypothetical protein
MIDYLRAESKHDLDFLISMIVNEPEIAEWGIDIHLDSLAGCRSIAEVLLELHRIYAQSKSKDIWGEKTPRFVRHLHLLGSHFPDAKFIHVVRDPRAVANSLIHSDVHYSTPLHGSRRWLIDTSAGLSYERDAPERVIRIYYEELMRDTEKYLKEITSFLGIGFEANMLIGTVGAGEYSSFYDNIHHNLDRELSTKHIDKWMRQLDEKSIQIIESITHDQMLVLGYKPTTEPIEISRAIRIKMQLHRMYGLVKQLSKYSKQRRDYLNYLLKRKWQLGLLKEFLWTINY